MEQNLRKIAGEMKSREAAPEPHQKMKRLGNTDVYIIPFTGYSAQIDMLCFHILHI